MLSSENRETVGLNRDLYVREKRYEKLIVSTPSLYTVRTGTQFTLTVATKKSLQWEIPKPGFVVFERDGIRAVQRFDLTSEGYSFTVTPDESWSPGVRVFAYAFDKERVERGEYFIPVPPMDKKLSIDIVFEDETQDEKASVLTVTVRDKAGNPVPNAEVSVSVYSSLLRQRMHPLKEISLFDSMHLYAPPKRFGDELGHDYILKPDVYRLITGPKYGFGRFSGGFDEFVNYLDAVSCITEPEGMYGVGGTRTEFRMKEKGRGSIPAVPYKETVVWEPSLVTDENGVVSLSVTFPDTAAEWIVEVHAVGPDSRFGSVTEMLKIVEETSE